MDAHYLPVYMKKGRPAYQLQVICREQERQQLEQIIFAETTTIGIRRTEMLRTVLPRRKVTLATSAGAIEVKVCQLPDGQRVYPEYDSAVQAARQLQIPLREVYAAVQAAQKNIK